MIWKSLSPVFFSSKKKFLLKKIQTIYLIFQSIIQRLTRETKKKMDENISRK